MYCWGQKFTPPFQNMLNVNYFTKIRGIIQNAYYYLFSTDQNKILTYCPQEKIIEFIKATPFKSLHPLDPQLLFSDSCSTEGLICNYYRRFERSLMLQKEKSCVKSWGWKLLNRMEMCTFFLFCLNIIFFSLSTALQRLQNIVTFPRRQNKLNLA